MSLGLHESRARRRRKARWSVIKWLIALVAISGGAVYAYTSGSHLAEREVADLQQTVDELNDQLGTVREERSTLQNTLEDMEHKLAEAEERYQANVPGGALAEILRLSEEKLNTGVEPARLAFLIRSAANEPDCKPDSTEKRFFVKTPTSSSGKTYVTFVGGTLTVSAKGLSAKDANGKLEAWFAPSEPVTLSFTDPGGSSSEISGVLPVQHALVMGEREMRFNFVEGRRGYIRVAAQTCELEGGQ